MKLEDLKKLCDEATPGPWGSRMNPWTYRGTVDAKGEHVASTTRFEDGDFMAAAREALPKLIAVAEAADAMREELLDAHDADPYIVKAASIAAFDTALAALESK